MKRYFQILTVMCILLTSVVANAQNQRRFPEMRERILNAKFNEICMQMELPKPQAEELRPIYLRYEREKNQLLLDRLAQPDFSDSTLTDQQEEERYLARLEKAKKLVELREKYYPEFRKVLSPKQVVQFHRTEMEVNRKMMQNLRKRFNERLPEMP